MKLFSWLVFVILNTSNITLSPKYLFLIFIFAIWYRYQQRQNIFFFQVKGKQHKWWGFLQKKNQNCVKHFFIRIACCEASKQAVAFCSSELCDLFYLHKSPRACKFWIIAIIIFDPKIIFSDMMEGSSDSRLFSKPFEYSTWAGMHWKWEGENSRFRLQIE